MSEPAFVFVDADDEDVIERSYEAVFRPAFDATELPDISLIVPSSTRLLLVATDGASVVAGAVADTDPLSNVGLLSYMATRPSDRSRGLGAKLLTALRARWTSDGTDLVVAEVRDPRVWQTSDTERPEDRLRFYDRNGCHLLPVPWLQPAVGSHGRESGMLLLTVHGAKLGSLTEASRLVQWAEHYYIEAEGRTPTDPQYTSLIGLIAAEDLEVVAIESFRSVPLL